MTQALSTPKTGTRKPRVALMGEFSAGKSTLLNMLLAQTALPVMITATSMPPVWISYGAQPARRVLHDGTEAELPKAELTDVSLEDTKYVKLWLETEILELCDLVDMPGISDPNMPSDIWLSVFDEVDSVIWCTHATQAWRQSEAAAWEEISGRTNGHNVLAITQFDKIMSERDQSRLMNRINKETSGQFEAVFPLSLLRASFAKDKEDWNQSGAASFCAHLIEGLVTRGPEKQSDANENATDASVEGASLVAPKRVTRRARPETPSRERLSSDQVEIVSLEAKRADM